MNRRTILVVDDDESLRRVTQLQLEEAGHEVLTASNVVEALSLIEEDTPALVITDLKMPGLSGLELLNKIRISHPDITIVMITAFGTVQTAVEAMKAGAYDYITKPIDYEELVLVVNRAMERQRLVEEVRTLRTSLDRKYGFESIIGQSKTLLQVLEMAARVAQRDSTVLIQGETGTGKELLAKATIRIVAGKASRSSRSTAGRYLRISWNRSFSAIRKGRSRGHSHPNAARWRWRMAEPSSWTRLENCRWNCKSNCCD